MAATEAIQYCESQVFNTTGLRRGHPIVNTHHNRLCTMMDLVYNLAYLKQRVESGWVLGEGGRVLYIENDPDFRTVAKSYTFKSSPWCCLADCLPYKSVCSTDSQCCEGTCANSRCQSALGEFLENRLKGGYGGMSLYQKLLILFIVFWVGGCCIRICCPMRHRPRIKMKHQ
eukprot:737178_1